MCRNKSTVDFVTDEGTRNYDQELRKANQECDMYKEKYGELKNL